MFQNWRNGQTQIIIAHCFLSTCIEGNYVFQINYYKMKFYRNLLGKICQQIWNNFENFSFNEFYNFSMILLKVFLE